MQVGRWVCACRWVGGCACRWVGVRVQVGGWVGVRVQVGGWVGVRVVCACVHVYLRRVGERESARECRLGWAGGW